MIPYEELCAALDQWRIKNGLSVGYRARHQTAAGAGPPPPPGMDFGDTPIEEQDAVVHEIDGDESGVVIDEMATAGEIQSGDDMPAMDAVPEAVPSGYEGGYDEPPYEAGDATIVAGEPGDEANLAVGDATDLTQAAADDGIPDEIRAEGEERPESTSEIDLDNVDIVEESAVDDEDDDRA